MKIVKLAMTTLVASAISFSAYAADIVDTAKSAGSFNTLLAAATAAGLADTLKGDGPLTVFAPTDEAFAALPAGTVEKPSQTGEQGPTGRSAHLPRCCWQGDVLLTCPKA